MNKFQSELKKKFSEIKPLLVSQGQLAVAELKPYLQPFEEALAIDELKALVGQDLNIDFEFPYASFELNDVSHLEKKLAYWQRVGIQELIPTDQVLRELTQNGKEETFNKSSLHKARRLRYGVHNLHEYRGKFFPQLVKSLINKSNLDKNAKVLDPMCGSGTTLVEAQEAGFDSIGADLNPLSILISNTKCRLIHVEMKELQDLTTEVRERLESGCFPKIELWSDADLKYLSSWFDDLAFEDVEKIITVIYSFEGIIKDFLLVCLSNIIRAVSYQKESDLRVRKEIKSYDKGYAISLFFEQLQDQLDRVIAYKMVSEVPQHESLIFPCNSIELPIHAKEHVGTVDLIITSPPYATALPYLDTDRLSLVVLGLLVRKEHKVYEANMIGTREVTEKQRRDLWDIYLARQSELPESINNVIEHVAKYNHSEGVGFRRRNLPALLGKYFLSMLEAMKSARKMMKPHGKAFYIVGNNSTSLNGEKFEINTPELLFDLAEFAGWRKVTMSSMELLSSRDMFRANRGTSEIILELENQ
ncbi:DNA methyltransferase [Pseudoalteromonas pernae]|uniref:DNA methyltransferase n=1 Tax=Pseudoalteromonas pernae TaxID=3118054 RepID=UPI0032426875